MNNSLQDTQSQISTPKTLKQLYYYFGSKRYLVSLVFLLQILATIAQILGPVTLGKATTVIYSGVRQGLKKTANGHRYFSIDFPQVAQILLIVALLYIASAALNYAVQVILAYLSQKIVYQLRRNLKEKMSRVPVSYYDTHSNGNIMSTAINDIDNISNLFNQILTQSLSSIIQFLGILLIMIVVSWKLTLIALLTIPIILLILSKIAPKSQKLFSGQQNALGALDGIVEEAYGGYTEISAFNQQKKINKKFSDQNQTLRDYSWKAQFVSGILMPLMNVVKNAGYILVAIIGGIEVINHTITIGNVQAFLTYMNQFSQPIQQMANIINNIQSLIASAKRIFGILNENEMKTNLPTKAPIQTNKKVIFDHVKFGYSPKKIIIKNFNLSVKKGENIAIAGPTGAGKTTLINLLERFYEVNDGSIRLNGVDIKNINRDKLRQHIAIVLQDTWLFSGTIFENIKYGAQNKVSDKQVYQAAKAAHVNDFAKGLPKGYQTMINENSDNISQGQRQLITIARAFVANPEILILDEATSSVDTRTENLIQKAMQQLLKKRTSFVIAHRLSTIQDADNIIVMNNGEVIETGNHQQLIQKNGFYTNLYNSQFN